MFDEAQRIARDPETGKNYYIPADMTYKEWKDSLTESQGKAFLDNQKMANYTSADKKQFDEYKDFIREAQKEYGKEAVNEMFDGFPTKFDDFQKLKHTDTDKWEIIKDNRNELAKGLLKDDKYSMIYTDSETFEKDVHNLIKDEYPLTLNERQQNRHIEGSPNYDPTRSTLTANPQELIDLYAGKSEPRRTDARNWAKKEWFQHKEDIGTWRNEKGDEAPTDKGMIHYSKRGVHIVPSDPKYIKKDNK